MEKFSPGDLEGVKASFDAWRKNRKGRTRIPEQLLDAAIALLDYYPFHKIRKELNLNTKQLQKVVAAAKYEATPSEKLAENTIPTSKSIILETTEDQILTHNLTLSTQQEFVAHTPQICQITLERRDGTRLSLSLPLDWRYLPTLCQRLWKAGRE